MYFKTGLHRLEKSIFIPALLWMNADYEIKQCVSQNLWLKFTVLSVFLENPGIWCFNRHVWVDINSSFTEAFSFIFFFTVIFIAASERNLSMCQSFLKQSPFHAFHSTFSLTTCSNWGSLSYRSCSLFSVIPGSGVRPAVIISFKEVLTLLEFLSSRILHRK